MPERASARGLPRHERAGPDEVRGLRRCAARARAPPGCGPLQGVRLLLDRLRPWLAQVDEGVGERLRLLGLGLFGLRLVVLRLELLVVGLGFVVRRRRGGVTAAQDKSWPRAQPGPNVVVGSCGAERPTNIEIVRASSSLGAPVPPGPRSAPSRQWRTLPPDERNLTQPS